MKKYIIAIICSLFVVGAAEASSPSDVVISEIKIGETGASTKEFVELFNRTDIPVSLDGWSLKKKTSGGTESNLASPSKFIGTIPAHGFFLVAHPDYRDEIGADMGYSGSSYSFSANNTILLYDENETLIDKVGFGEAGDFERKPATALDDGQSLARNNSGGTLADTDDNSADFSLTNSPIPHNSSSVFSSVSPDAPEPVLPVAESSPVAASDASGSQSPYDMSDDIIISEIFPNPYLADNNGEFIELHNKGDRMVDLTGWRLGDDSGKQFLIPTSTKVRAYGFYAAYRPETGIVLENDSDSVKLYKPFKSISAETVKYKDAPESYSYSRDLGNSKRWLWSYRVTPSSTNIVEPEDKEPEVNIDLPDEAKTGEGIIFDASDTIDPEGGPLVFLWSFGDGATSSLETAEHIFWKSGTYKVSVSVKDGKNTVTEEKKIKITSSKESVKITSEKATSSKDKTSAARKTVVKSAGGYDKTTGTVVSLPGRFGVQYFYMLAPKAVQVYNYKKDFPDLAIGDVIEVSGTRGEYAGMPRMKTAGQEDIEVIENGDAPEPREKKTSELHKGILGELVKISGEITGKKGQSVYIDDGSGEAEVYVKKGTDISMGNFTEGESITINGLVMPYKGGYQLWPRSVEDVEFGGKGAVLGESATSSEWAVSAREENTEWMKYLLIVMGGAIVILGSLILKQKINQSVIAESDSIE